MSETRFETRAIHEGYNPETGSRAVPIERTSAFKFRDTQHAADLFALKESGHIYTRLNNPTEDVLEERLASLEGGVAAVTAASGTAAIYNSIINICQQGDEVVSSSKLYGGTYTMFSSILPQFGISVKFVDPSDPENFTKAVTEKTRAFYTETIGNPTLDVSDIRGISGEAGKAGVPLIVDSTFTTPFLLNPLELGADIVVHSLTKWIGGHGTAIGGIAIDGGKFDWSNPKFDLYNKPDSSYHGLRFGHDLGDLQPAAFAVRMRTIPLRNLGACLSPDNIWFFLQGLETLSLRMERHSQNGLAVAQYLEKHPKVSWVRYPGLKKDSSWSVASGILTRGFGGMVVFGIEKGRDAGGKFINSLNLFSHVANVGDAKSLAIHPASTTHSQLSKEQLDGSGISDDLIRLSVGIEHIDDILSDLEQALNS